MDADTQARLERLVGPVAWAYYADLEELDVGGLLTDYGGDVRLVAADVLEYAAESRATRAATGAQALKAFKVPGEYEEEYFAPPVTADGLNVQAWREKAVALRNEVRRAARSRMGSVSVPVEVGW